MASFNVDRKKNGWGKRKKEREAELHKNHRQRVKEKFRETGLQGFHAHNVLEMLLFYSVPRIDTNETAHRLLNEFGAFDAVLDAPLEALMRVDGVGLESATLLKFITEVCSYYIASKVQHKTLIDNSEAAAEYLRSYFINAVSEKFVVMYLDGRSNIIKCTEFSQNENNMVYSDFRTITKEGYLLDAAGVIIAHNHPCGFANPSNNDKILTENLSATLNSFDMHLCEHIIFSNDDVCFCSRLSKFKKNIFAFG
ncbi:MAG: hypothetical protein E7573_07600 [Ruminococcaceae bacterium]|nr:hypothetical protein [Oscillospiraceae bacterium]